MRLRAWVWAGLALGIAGCRGSSEPEATKIGPDAGTEAPAVTIELTGRETIVELMALAQHEDPVLRRQAIEELGRQGRLKPDLLIFRALVTALEDSDVEVAMGAARALGDYEDREAMRPLEDLAGKPSLSPSQTREVLDIIARLEALPVPEEEQEALPPGADPPEGPLRDPPPLDPLPGPMPDPPEGDYVPNPTQPLPEVEPTPEPLPPARDRPKLPPPVRPRQPHDPI